MVYNPGGQKGESVQGGGQRPAKDPNGPFLGKSSNSAKASPGKDSAAGTTNPDQPSTEKPKQKQ